MFAPYGSSPLPRRRGALRRAQGGVAAILLALLAWVPACGDDGPHRPRSASLDDTSLDGSTRGPALYQIPPDPNPAIEQSAPVTIGSSICPGVYVQQVDRHFTAAPPGAPPLAPRLFGRDESARVWTLRDVLLCELRVSYWVLKFRDEGAYLILWRGPAVFAPDDDCDWREPWRTEHVEGVGRRLTFHEHCRRRAHGGPADRMLTAFVDEAYHAITVRPATPNE